MIHEKLKGKRNMKYLVIYGTIMLQHLCPLCISKLQLEREVSKMKGAHYVAPLSAIM
jgi:hypothetical protein